jgi:glycosyltransferase involved in cell wall biosynthesis
VRREKIAFVCQRYGLEVNGGSELYCRQLAEKLTEHYDVEVYTTCAIDYVTWKNEYQPGMEEIHGVTVHRFLNVRQRDQRSFDQISQRVFANAAHSDAEESKWIEEQGPVCLELLDELAKKHREYKAVIFMTYLYYLSAKGLPMGFENALLIPTVHDESPVYLRYYDSVFSSAKGFIWNTPEERDFAERRFPNIRKIPGVLAGIGVDVPEGPLPEIPESLRVVPYITYAGRIDESKGCGEMFRYFQEYKKQYGGMLKLVLMGKAVMEIPSDPDIVSLGFVSDEMKFAVMASARALVLFSQFESLSMIVLESMIMGRPVLVNGKCEVLKGHCVRSNAGLYFTSYTEFVGTLNYLFTHPTQYEVMSENAVKYVEENYRWERIVETICQLIEGSFAR